MKNWDTEYREHIEKLEQQIKELEEFKDMTIRSCIVGLEEGEQKKFDKIVNNQK